MPTDSQWIRAILRGMLPNLFEVLPPHLQPYTIEGILWFGDNLEMYLPQTDPFWTTPTPQAVEMTPPDLQVTVQNSPPRTDVSIPTPSSFASNIICFRCGEKGHHAGAGICKRVKGLRRPRRRRRALQGSRRPLPSTSSTGQGGM